ncbi:MAG TPA: M24 family metallopeptidase [Mycobacteriales bacterium]|jgi:Xaa-Pro aminopeptidase|nr:M24 family metallopeptidase [Mycobacteriales bacterium]
MQDVERVERLRDAQRKATDLFTAIEAAGIIAAGVTERQANEAIKKLAAERLGVETHWHKRVVRAGVNALEPYHSNPPDRAIGTEDIVYLDLGPVFEEWEADFGRTYVIGDDPERHRLRDALPVVWAAGREHFEATPRITGSELFAFMVEQAAAHRYEWGGTIAGHLVGDFPHADAEGSKDYSRIAPANDRPLRGVDSAGNVAHWILEVHLVDREREIGGFYEELLDI